MTLFTTRCSAFQQRDTQKRQPKKGKKRLNRIPQILQIFPFINREENMASATAKKKKTISKTTPKKKGTVVKKVSKRSITPSSSKTVKARASVSKM